jgi:hypothetical protein
VLVFALFAMSYLRLGEIVKAVSSVVPYCCDMSPNSPLSWPLSSLVFLFSADVSCHAVVDDRPLTDCSPAVVPGAGRVARRAPAPDLPTAAPMSRGPPPPAPVSFRGLTIFSRNRFCVYSSASVSPAAPPDPDFRVCGPPSGPSVSARAFLVSVDRRSPLAAARVSAFTMFLGSFLNVSWGGHSALKGHGLLLHVDVYSARLSATEREGRPATCSGADLTQALCDAVHPASLRPPAPSSRRGQQLPVRPRSWSAQRASLPSSCGREHALSNAVRCRPQRCANVLVLVLVLHRGAVAVSSTGA